MIFIGTGEHGEGIPHGFAYENIEFWDHMCQTTSVFTHFLEVPWELHKITYLDDKMKNPH